MVASDGRLMAMKSTGDKYCWISESRYVDGRLTWQSDNYDEYCLVTNVLLDQQVSIRLRWQSDDYDQYWWHTVCSMYCTASQISESRYVDGRLRWQSDDYDAWVLSGDICTVLLQQISKSRYVDGRLGWQSDDYNEYCLIELLLINRFFSPRFFPQSIIFNNRIIDNNNAQHDMSLYVHVDGRLGWYSDDYYKYW